MIIRIDMTFRASICSENVSQLMDGGKLHEEAELRHSSGAQKATSEHVIKLSTVQPSATQGSCVLPGLQGPNAS